MDTDKNQNDLEKQLKTLGQKVRIDILKKLKNTPSPIPFSRLQKDVLGYNSSSVNLSFHLNTLKKSDLISSSEEGYSITSLGDQILEKILSIEKILDSQLKAKMIRTSKYSKELFDINKIEEYLVGEGELDRYLARQIAHEVEERLSKTNIEYMTAPLMREYINAILLENGLEEVRHKLTRLGTPPFEAFKLFNSKNTEITPHKFIDKLGSDVSEQFLLLNLLPKNLADLYLTGEIALLNLNYWALRPLSLYVNTKTLIEDIIKRHSYSRKEIENPKNLIKLINYFSDTLYQLKEFYSENLSLGEFNRNFLCYFDLTNNNSSEIDLLVSQILRFNKLFNDDRSSLSLDFNLNRKLKEGLSDKSQSDYLFLLSLENQATDMIKPNLSFECSNLVSSELDAIILDLLTTRSINENIILYNKSYSQLTTSNLITIPSSTDNFVILDKILVNLHMISIDAKQNDQLFFEILRKRLNNIFQLFGYKEKLVTKKLHSLKQWNIITKQIFNMNTEEIFKNSIKSISFFGLNEAVLNHCGIELDRLQKSENFALKVLSFMKKIILEKKEEGNNNYILSQPHNDSYLNNLLYNGKGCYPQKQYVYSSELIRRDSNLPLDKKIAIFKKFQKNLDGGAIFIEKKPPEMSYQKFFNKLFESGIGTISLDSIIPHIKK
ncbi:MAG: anaerobic ribonucleoside-triphosphate reductase, partial [Candidatus Thorarchaeota archaeon]